MFHFCIHVHVCISFAKMYSEVARFSHNYTYLNYGFPAHRWGKPKWECVAGASLVIDHCSACADSL